MNSLRTIKTTRLSSGTVVLSDRQAEGREPSLDNVGGGVYRILKTIQFKAGEEFQYDGDVPKGFTETIGTKEEVIEKPAVEKVIKTKVTEPADEYSDMSKAELKAACDKRGIKCSPIAGKKKLAELLR